MTIWKSEGGLRLLECENMIASERNATDLVGVAFSARPDWIVIPLAKLAPTFLDLKTGLAGAILQKFVNYDLKVAIIGDTTQEEARSKPLADFIRETNKGNQIWFCGNREALLARLS